MDAKKQIVEKKTRGIAISLPDIPMSKRIVYKLEAVPTSEWNKRWWQKASEFAWNSLDLSKSLDERAANEQSLKVLLDQFTDLPKPELVNDTIKPGRYEIVSTLQGTVTDFDIVVNKELSDSEVLTVLEDFDPVQSLKEPLEIFQQKLEDLFKSPLWKLDNSFVTSQSIEMLRNTLFLNTHVTTIPSFFGFGDLDINVSVIFDCIFEEFAIAHNEESEAIDLPLAIEFFMVASNLLKKDPDIIREFLGTALLTN